MKVYTFKCEDCGSKKYEKLNETTYVCSYCGRVEEVYYKKEQQEQERLAKEQAEQQAKEQAVKEQSQPVYDDHPRIRNVSLYDVLVLVFTFVFGYLGVHRFMRGKIITGLLYLFTYGLLGFGWFIDIIREVIRFARKYRGNY